MSAFASLVPPLGTQMVVNAAAARQDRVFAAFSGWRLQGTNGEFREFATQVRDLVPAGDGGEGAIFGAHSGNMPSHAKWQVLGGGDDAGAAWTGRPLFGGYLAATRHGPNVPTENSRNTWRLTADLALNPTRWLLHQSIRIIQTPLEQWPAVPPRMFATEEPWRDEIPLVRALNVHLGTNRHLGLALPHRWPTQLRRYVAGTLDLLQTAIQQACDTVGLTLQRPSFLVTLKQIETYWEFSTTSPLEDMAQLEGHVRSVAARSQVGWRSIDESALAALPSVEHITVGNEDNSPVVRIQLGAGRSLRVYAKTDRRLRFEVVHDCKAARGVFPRYTADTEEALYGWLDDAAADAATSLNSVLAAIRELRGVSPRPRRAHELVAGIFSALADHPVTASVIVSALVANGRITRSASSPLGDAIDTLRGRGLLVFARRAGLDFIYVVHADYRRALARLRSDQVP